MDKEPTKPLDTVRAVVYRKNDHYWRAWALNRAAGRARRPVPLLSKSGTRVRRRPGKLGPSDPVTFAAGHLSSPPAGRRRCPVARSRAGEPAAVRWGGGAGPGQVRASQNRQAKTREGTKLGRVRVLFLVLALGAAVL